MSERSHENDLGSEHLDRNHIGLDRMAALRCQVEILRPEAKNHLAPGKLMDEARLSLGQSQAHHSHDGS